MNFPESVKKLIYSLSGLPSIGPRQATRLVFYLISQGQNQIRNIAADIDSLHRIKICERCFFIHQNPENLCDICKDKTRNHELIAIIEKETDLISIEKTKKFNGRYFIIGPISKTGILEDWQKLRLQSLKNFIKKEFSGQVQEIILALNPNTFGNYNASLLTKEIHPLTKKITRLGRGLPTGGEIEFADDETLGESLAKRD